MNVQGLRNLFHRDVEGVDVSSRKSPHVESMHILSERMPPPSAQPSQNTTNLQCVSHEHTEYDGNVMVPGNGVGATVSTSPSDCCNLCAKTRGCNVWVACAGGWCGNQCWLKWVEDPKRVTIRGANEHISWTSGTMMKDMPSLLPRPSEETLNKISVVVLKTKFGDLRIELKPEWHGPSVRFVREASLSDSCTVKCEFYRAEPGFLLQGAMRAVVTPNKRCRKFVNGPEECTDPMERPGGYRMEAGDIAWAGGSAGPDFFIMMNANGFGATHTVWGRLADAASMALARELVLGNSSSPPRQMRILDDPVGFTMLSEP